MKIYKLYPEFKDYLWGGTKLKKEYNKITNNDIVAESWELSLHKDGLTKLYDGRTLLESIEKKQFGYNCEKFSFFPVLVKFIDAKQKLSVQVHPSDEYALKNENSFGKTEMWYVAQADVGAGIYLGFKEDVCEEQVRKAILDNTLTQLLNFYQVKSGECYFIPAGTIHAMGEGCLICEIQQNSNLTYRVFDFGRKDKNGNERELHIDKALKVANLTKQAPIKYEGDFEIVNEYFTVNKFSIKSDESFFVDKSSFNCITCVSGQGYIEDMEIKKGDSFFVPAGFGRFTLKGKLDIIITKV